MATRSSKHFLQSLLSLELEEKILNGASVFAILGLFLPWLSGEWLGNAYSTYSGFGFFTSYLGVILLLLNIFQLILTIAPLLNGPPLLRGRTREIVRLCIAAQSVVLTLAILSVLTNVTLEFSSMEVRFGVYVTLASSVVSLFYATFRLQEQQRTGGDLIPHPTHVQALEGRGILTPHREPPPAPAAEEHPLYP